MVTNWTMCIINLIDKRAVSTGLKSSRVARSGCSSFKKFATRLLIVATRLLNRVTRLLNRAIRCDPGARENIDLHPSFPREALSVGVYVLCEILYLLVSTHFCRCYLMPLLFTVVIRSDTDSRTRLLMLSHSLAEHLALWSTCYVKSYIF